MGPLSSKLKLFHNEPFPANAGPTQVVRKISRISRAGGPSAMPHEQPRPAYPPLDATGRIVVEDGDGRLRAGWPDSHMQFVSTLVQADFLFSIMLWNTDKLNEYMARHQLLAFCVLDDFKVVQLVAKPFEQASKEYPGASSDMDGAVASLQSDRFTTGQLQEVTTRLMHAYLDYGVGALIMDHDQFVYQVMVPGTKDYLQNKVLYDSMQEAVTVVNDERHAGSKRTRSGACFGKK